MKLYVLLGNPIPLARARFGHRKVYNSQKNEQLIAGLDLARQHGDDPLFSGPLHMYVTFYMAIPQSVTAKKRDAMIGRPHTFKADLDNLLKMVCDYCNKVIYNDDCIIASITAKKIYDVNPRTEFTLKVIT